MKNKVAFVLFRYPLGVSSMIINSIQIFARSGIDVDVYIDSDTFNASPANFEEKGINIIQFESPFKKRFLSRFLAKYSTLSLRFLDLVKRFHKIMPSVLVRLLYLEDYVFSIWLRRRISSGYDYIFPVEAKALISVTGLKGRIIYYNMEMLDWAETNPIYGKDKILLKILESRALRGVEAVAIQNDARAAQFRKINNFSKEVHILPVAAMGEPVRSRGTYLSEKFNIPEDKRIVIYSGNVTPWAKCLEIVESVKDWPDDFCLVIHTWNRGVFASGYGLEVRNRAEGLPVYLSDDYVELDELPRLLSSANVALMFYQDIDANFTEILFSSNKLAEYLKAGLPVITSDFPALKKFVSEAGIGNTVGSMQEIPSALVGIIDRYDYFKDNVIRCYQNHFRFETYFEPFLKDLYS